MLGQRLQRDLAILDDVYLVARAAQVKMDHLLAAQGQVKSYMAAMQNYLACIDKEMDAKGDDATAEYKSLMVNRHNSAVSEMESVAGAFNDQIKAFKAANPTPAKK